MKDTVSCIQSAEASLTHSEEVVDELEAALNRYARSGLELTDEMLEMLEQINTEPASEIRAVSTTVVPYFAILA